VVVVVLALLLRRHHHHANTVKNASQPHHNPTDPIHLSICLHSPPILYVLNRTDHYSSCEYHTPVFKLKPTAFDELELIDCRSLLLLLS